MGWWPFSNPEDPFKDLDPDLRKFLDAEQLPPSSTTSSRTQPRRRHRDPNSNEIYRDELSIPPPKGPPANVFARVSQREKDESANAPTGLPSEIPLPVSAESLFPDGRYAHLWRTYKSAAQVEAEGKSDAERLSDVLHAYTARKHELKLAALENCASAQINLHNCFKSGRWKTRMMMCKEENRELERCVRLQHQLLRALGFMSMWERSDEEADRIQVHADRLYQRMLREEAEAEDARAKGLPAPVVRPLINEKRPDQQSEATEAPLEPGEVRPVTDEYTWDSIQPQKKEYYLKQKWKDLSPSEVELAKKDWNQQVLLYRVMQQRVRDHELADYRDRTMRERKGQPTFGDRLKSWFDMREYPEIPPDEGESGQGEKQK
ncbi:MAG: hypothetical protein M1828_002231 [Chrysothrix sp. TS-e1954]|nr:MAG: hypothetical protein M1828_002231 [Chrysothrix sp. TS-e1954]